jgi:hypothetical protein
MDRASGRLPTAIYSTRKNRSHAARAEAAVGRDAWGKARGGIGVVLGSSESGGRSRGPCDALLLTVYRLPGEGMRESRAVGIKSRCGS